MDFQSLDDSLTAVTPSPRSRSLLRHADFLKLWSAETISQFGTQVTFLAVPLVAITLLNATPLEIGLLGTFEFLPFILFALPAGAWVDRLRRRPILIATDVGRAISLLSIPVAAAFDALTMPHLYAVGFINGVMTVFFDVSYQSYLPSLVERDQIVEGNSKLEVSRSSAQIAGPPVSGLLIGVLGAPIAIVADAVSFLASALFVLGIRRAEPPVDRRLDETGKPRGSMRSEIAEGLRYVLGHSYLRAIAASTGISNLFATMAFVVYLVFLVRELGLTPQTIGFVLGVGGIGTLAGALLSGRIARAVGVGRTIILAMALTGPAMLLIAGAPRGNAIPFLVAAGLVFGLGGMVYNITQVSFRQAITPLRMQGRMNATMRFIVWGTIPVGQIVGGFLGGAIGLRETIWIGAVGSLFAFLPLLVGPLKGLREMPEPVVDNASPEIVAEALSGLPDPAPMPPPPVATSPPPAP
jgi:MFS family permease